VHSGNKDLQVESEKLCTLWYSDAQYGYVHSSVCMFGVVLHSVISVCSACLSAQFYFKLLMLL